MTIADKKVGVELPYIKGDLTNTLRSIDTAEDSQLFTRGSQALERHAHTGLADDSIEDSDFDCIASFLFPAYSRLEEIHEHVVRHRIRIVDLHRLSWSGFAYVLDSLST